MSKRWIREKRGGERKRKREITVMRCIGK